MDGEVTAGADDTDKLGHRKARTAQKSTRVFVAITEFCGYRAPVGTNFLAFHSL